MNRFESRVRGSVRGAQTSILPYAAVAILAIGVVAISSAMSTGAGAETPVSLPGQGAVPTEIPAVSPRSSELPPVAAHRTREQVLEVVKERLTSLGKHVEQPIPIEVRQAVAVRASEVRRVEPEAMGLDIAPDEVVWVIRAKGSFVGLRLPPGASPVVRETGYFIVRDSTGEILSMGMP